MAVTKKVRATAMARRGDDDPAHREFTNQATIRATTSQSATRTTRGKSETTTRGTNKTTVQSSMSQAVAIKSIYIFITAPYIKQR